MDMKALDLAIEIAQGPAALARALGIKPPSIFGWYARKRIPAERCAAIEAATGVPRHALRPDIFPVPNLQRGPSGASGIDVDGHVSLFTKAAALAGVE